MGKTVVSLALISTLTAPLSAAPDDEDQPDPAAQQASQQSSSATLEEHVFVEGSLPYVPENNTIVSKLPTELRLTPNNVGVVTKPLFTEQFDRVLGDSLVNVSNINVQTQNGVHDFFYIRGFDSLTSSLVLTDGASEPEATFYQLYNVEVVEVLKGPGGFLYGSNPLSGTVNLVRKQPLPANLIDLHAAVGSFDNYEGSFDWNYGAADKPGAFRLNGLYRDQGSYREGKGGQTAAINPSFSWRFDDTTSLNLNFEYLDLDFVPDSGLPVLRDEVPPVDLDTNYQSDADTSQQTILRFQGDFQKEITDFLTVRDKLFFRELDWLSTGTIYNGALPTGPSVSLIRTLLELDDRQNFVGNMFEAIWSFDTGSVQHKMLTGLEVDRFADEFTLGVNLLAPVDLFNPVEPPVPPLPLPDAGLAGDARSIVVAPYVVDQIQLGSMFSRLAGRANRFDRLPGRRHGPRAR